MLFLVLFVVCFLGSLVGLFYLIFKKGRRKKGALAAAVLFIASIFFAAMLADQDARKEGWASSTEKQKAEDLGITDPKEFQLMKPQLEAEAKARAEALKEQQEKAKAEKLAQQQRELEQQQKEIAFYAPPPEQVAMVAAIDKAKSAYRNAANDLAKGGIRRDRARAICNSISGRRISGWTGEITQLTTNGEGKGVLAISIGDEVSVTTMNNMISDIGSNTLIDPDSPVFRKLEQLSEGQKVRFSGTFVRPPTSVDCLYELSLTMDGAMEDPEFLVRFSAVDTYN